jgi:peroxiredoxin
LQNKLEMPLQLNQPAPDFTLFDTNKKRISLQDYRGKNVVLLFFPFAFSGTCTKELCEMRDNYSFYTNLNAEVIGISVDSLYTNAKYKETHQFIFPLLSDFNKEVSELYDALFEEFNFDYHGVSNAPPLLLTRMGILCTQRFLPHRVNIPTWKN